MFDPYILKLQLSKDTKLAQLKKQPYVNVNILDILCISVFGYNIYIFFMLKCLFFVLNSKCEVGIFYSKLRIHLHSIYVCFHSVSSDCLFNTVYTRAVRKLLRQPPFCQKGSYTCKTNYMVIKYYNYVILE